MDNKKLCYLTLDYELFLGTESGTVDNCLIRPTYELCKILDSRSVKATFFVDAAYLLKLQEISSCNYEAKKSLEEICNQIQWLEAQGHSIQLHFHPQWLYSSYSDSGWLIDATHYKIDDMPKDDAQVYLRKAIVLLNSFLKTPVNTYRAGGYTLNNFSIVRNVFEEFGITKDTSVLSGMQLKSEYQQYDYTKIQSGNMYYFEDSLGQPDINGTFVEYPISTKALGIVKTFTNLLLIKYAYKFKNNVQWGDGNSVKRKKENLSFFSRFIGIKSSHIVASIDGIKSIWLSEIAKSNYKNGNLMVIIGHPKLITPFSLRQLDKYLARHSSLYQVF